VNPRKLARKIAKELGDNKVLKNLPLIEEENILSFEENLKLVEKIHFRKWEEILYTIPYNVSSAIYEFLPEKTKKDLPCFKKNYNNLHESFKKSLLLEFSKAIGIPESSGIYSPETLLKSGEILWNHLKNNDFPNNLQKPDTLITEKIIKFSSLYPMRKNKEIIPLAILGFLPEHSEKKICFNYFDPILVDYLENNEFNYNDTVYNLVCFANNSIA
jgi:hypothetical protein